MDGNGRPVRGAFLIFYISGDGDFGPNLDPIGTDAEGRFVRDDVLPGLPYRIFAEGADIGSVGVAKELAVEPGEAIDLGTINVTREDRPEPKRSKAANTGEKEMGTAAIVSGRVVGPNGKPVAGARVAAIGGKLRVGRGGDEVPLSEAAGRSDDRRAG